MVGVSRGMVWGIMKSSLAPKVSRGEHRRVDDGCVDSLRRMMDAFVGGMWRHPVMLLGNQGRLTPLSVLRYLKTIDYLIRFTPTCLERAIARCLDETTLRDVFVAKLAEEKGHEAWVENDIRVLREHFALTEEVEVLAGARPLAATFSEAVEREPVAYLVYALTTEYITVCLGPKTVQVLHERCGIPREALTVLSLHAEADVAHAGEGFRVLAALTLSARRQQSVESYLRRYLAHYRTIFDSLAETAQPVALGPPGR